ncbi:hypothetical protein AB1M95_00275 [Sulfitobacter sp. LCG007]
MFARMSGAAMRGLLVALLIATPALLLPGVIADQSQIVVLVAVIASIMTFIEYNSNSPSIVEFRDAAPFNRLRFITLFLTVFLLTAIAKGRTDPTVMTENLTAIGTVIGSTIDFPYSPVRLVVLMLPIDVSLDTVHMVRTAAGISYIISLIALVAFILMVRGLGWPTRGNSFNVWVNLPLFDPTAGGDVLYRLQRDARLNIAMGFLLPFVIPAVVKGAALMIDPLALDNMQTLIWTISAWAFLPASMIMRGIAMNRIAELIEEKRRRTYADAADQVAFQTA